ncbi:MAG: hypothetical protein E6K63_14635 [Nitrospirae bacterium]|nr:MAG: hypothetical protein E6K63_14635 [Nitrospirota bacterium]
MKSTYLSRSTGIEKGQARYKTSRSKVKHGDSLSLWLSLPHDAVPILIEGAEVRWPEKERFGVCFQTLLPHAQLRLTHYLRR